MADEIKNAEKELAKLVSEEKEAKYEVTLSYLAREQTKAEQMLADGKDLLAYTQDRLKVFKKNPDAYYKNIVRAGETPSAKSFNKAWIEKQAK